MCYNILIEHIFERSEPMYIQNEMSIEEKLAILSDAAKYDVACTSSGVDRKGDGQGMGNSVACGICHTFASDGRCISLLKILFSNECIFDCKYCQNRSSNDVKRASFSPEEVCDLTMEFYKRNYIEGLFLSSGIMVSPDYTMEQIYRALVLLRYQHRFNGYIHVKAIPGADPVLIEKTGWLADRMSVNLELPTAESLQKLAPHKNRKNILKPMRQIQLGIHESKENGPRLLTGSGDDIIVHQRGREEIREEILYTTKTSTLSNQFLLEEKEGIVLPGSNRPGRNGLLSPYKKKAKFVPAGQSTQMIIGATPETDYQLIKVAESLYGKFDLKRVFYSGYIAINEDVNLPSLDTKPPMLREHRLYQADWLMRFYGFEANEILSEDKPHFNVLLDPKCNWAMNHLEMFPLEVNKADYYKLLRVPGIGVKSAQRIIRARKTAVLDFNDLKKLGVVLKRALYFITCKGKMMYSVKIDEDYIMRNMLDMKDKKLIQLEDVNTFKQLSLFDTGFLDNLKAANKQISS